MATTTIPTIKTVLFTKEEDKVRKKKMVERYQDRDMMDETAKNYILKGTN